MGRALRRLLGRGAREDGVDDSQSTQLALPAPVPDRPPAPGPDPTRRLTPLLAELNALMSAHSKSRQVMRQLAFVEKALLAKGPRILDELPVHVLMRGKHQLTSLCEGAMTPGLAELNAAMSASLAKRTKVNAAAITMKGPTPTTPGRLDAALGSTGFPMIASPVHVNPKALDAFGSDDREFPEFRPTMPFEEMPQEPDGEREARPRRR